MPIGKHDETAADKMAAGRGTRPTQARDYWGGRPFDKISRAKRVIRAANTASRKKGVKVTLAGTPRP